MFTTPCFIRKYSEDFIKELESLGYHKFEFCGDVFVDGEDVLAAIELNTGEPVYSYVHLSNVENLNYVDCRENKTLFLAIAALRDDTIKGQWFWFNNGLFKCVGYGMTACMDGSYSIRLATKEDGSAYYDIKIEKVKKATVEELIEHFKQK